MCSNYLWNRSDFWHFENEKILISKKIQPCPFGLGLRKFALDPVFVIFFKKWQKNYKWWSNPIVVNFFEMHLLQWLDQVHFKKIYNDWIRPPLVIFLSFFEKTYNNWIKGKLPKSRFKWTGLLCQRIWPICFLTNQIVFYSK